MKKKTTASRMIQRRLPSVSPLQPSSSSYSSPAIPVKLNLFRSIFFRGNTHFSTGLQILTVSLLSVEMLVSPTLSLVLPAKNHQSNLAFKF